jgi:hypothetical protein
MPSKRRWIAMLYKPNATKVEKIISYTRFIRRTVTLVSQSSVYYVYYVLYSLFNKLIHL